MYVGATQAALWDTSDADPAKWKITDLSQLAADYGLGVPDVFSSLNRGYAIATNTAGDLVITGYGRETATGNNRAFVMTVPKSVAAAGYVSPKLTMSGTYPGPLNFTYFGAANTTTFLEYTSDLSPTASWTILDTQQNLSGNTLVQYTSMDSSPDVNQRFYRLRVVNN